MEELVGHRVEARGDVVVGIDPDGAVVRLLRLPPAEADRLVAVLQAAAGDHVEALLDVATAVNGDVVLVLPHLATALGGLLRQGLTAGEAVTVLVPLVGTLERLHAAGVAHGAIGVPAVRFDDRGAPVLTGFEHGMRRAGPAADAAFDAAAAADIVALRALAATVLGAAGPAAAGLVDELVSHALAPSALVDALFALAEPAPVRLGPRAAVSAPREPPGRLLAPARSDLEAHGPQREHAPRSALLGSAAVRMLRTLRSGLRAVRPRVWVAAGASLALLAAALVLLPGRGAAGAPEPVAGPPTSGASRSPATRPRPVPAATAVPREPLAAARMLVAERRRCLEAGSVRCLAAFESAGSPVAVEDAAAVAGAIEPVAVPEQRLRIRSHSGGTAVLTAGDRTVLLLEEPGGWRLRDVIGPPTRGSTARSGSAGD